MVIIASVTMDEIHQHVGREPTCAYILSSGKRCGRREVEHEVAMMQTPDAWPAWPVLPFKRMVNVDGAFSDLECGFIVEQPPKDAKVLYIGTIFEVNMLSKLPQKRYETFDEIYADGWRVD